MTSLNANEIIKKHIKTKLPGPKAKALLKRDKKVITPCYGRIYPFVMAKGRGAEVWDVDGNRFLDFMAGIAVANTGHAHPKVVEAVKKASDNFLHISSDDILNQLERDLQKEVVNVIWNNEIFDTTAIQYNNTMILDGAKKYWVVNITLRRLFSKRI